MRGEITTPWELLPGHELSDEEFLEDFFLAGSSSFGMTFRRHSHPDWNFYMIYKGVWSYWDGRNRTPFNSRWMPMYNERMRRRLIMAAFPEVIE